MTTCMGLKFSWVLVSLIGGLLGSSLALDVLGGNNFV